MVRMAGLGGLVAAVALLAVVPITYGLISPQPTESPTSWCGAWLFRADARACPSCCATAGAYGTRLDIAVLVGAVAAVLVVIALLGEWLAARVRAAD